MNNLKSKIKELNNYVNELEIENEELKKEIQFS